MKHLDEFESAFRDRFDEFESETQDSSWTDIQAKLHEKRRRRVAIWWWTFPISAMLMGGIFFFSSEQNRFEVELNKEVDTVALPKAIKKDTIEKNAAISDTAAVSSIIEKRDNVAIFSQNEDKLVFFKKKDTKNKGLFKQKKNEISENENDNIRRNIVSGTQQSTVNATDMLSAMTVAKKGQEDFLRFPFLENTIKTLRVDNSLPSMRFPRLETMVNMEKKTLFTPFLKMGMSAATTMNFRHLTPTPNDEFFLKNIKNPSYSTTQRIAYQISVDGELAFSKKMSLTSAVSFQQLPFSLSYDVQSKDIVKIEASVSQNGQALKVDNVVYQTSAESVNENWKMLGIATGAKVYLNKRNSVDVSFGSGRWLGKSKPEGVILFGTASVSHRLKNGLQLSPFLQYHFQNYMSPNKILQVQPYQVGLKIGF